LHAALRLIIEPYLSPEKYWTGLGLMHLELTHWVREAYGTNAVAALRTWSDHVFLEEGPNRRREEQWSAIAAYLRRPNFSAPDWIRDRMERLHQDTVGRDKALDDRLDPQRIAPLSQWDSRFSGAAYPEDTAASEDTRIGNVAACNNFLLAWRDTCADLTLESLAQLFQWARKIAPQIGFDWQLVRFPGTWDLDLDDLIIAGASGGIHIGPDNAA